MKKYKIFFLMILLVVLSGCSAKYSVNINSNGTVTEKVIMEFDTSSVEASDPKSFIEDTIKTYKDNNMYIDYNIKTNVTKDKTTITATRKYSSLNDYVNKSELLPILFEKTMYIDDYGINGIQTTGEYYYDTLFDTSIADEPRFDNIDINIHSQFNILENNSEKFDKKNNTLYWSINKDTKNFSIDFKYNNKKKYDIIIKDYLKSNWYTYLVLIGIAIIIVLIVKYIKKQDKLNNKI